MKKTEIQKLINLIKQNNLLLKNDVLFSRENCCKKLSFLKKKRRLDFANLSKNENITIQKEINFCVCPTVNSNNNNIHVNKCLPEAGNLEYNSKINFPKFKKDNISMYNETKINNIDTYFSNINKKKKLKYNKNILTNSLVYNREEKPLINNSNKSIGENINSTELIYSKINSK